MVVWEKMYYCSSCGVHVGLFEGEMVVVTGDAFRALRDEYHHTQNRYSAEIYDPLTWIEAAWDENNDSVWFEPDENRKSYGWYRARGLKELHDHSLWLELMSRSLEVACLATEGVLVDEKILHLLERQSLPFMNYVKQFPELEVRVIADASASFLAVGLVDLAVDLLPEQLVAGRDGAFRLCGVADGAGFPDVSSFFYGMYEGLCRQVTLYQG